LGTELEVTTLTEEKLSVKVPLSSQPNTTMRLRGRGLIDQNGQAGDLLVKLLADIPAAIAPEIITAIQQYRN
jgi:DnaJ-class molecular chaperone